MVAYQLSPYLETIENRLTKGPVESGLFHRLSGEIVGLNNGLQMFLLAAQGQKEINLDLDQLEKFYGPTNELVSMIRLNFLVPAGQTPLEHFLDYYVVRPLQNPAIGYRSSDGELIVVRVSMAEYVFGRKHNDLPEIIEETLPNLAATIFAEADGTKTLRQIVEAEGISLSSSEAQDAVEFLTGLERQLIKLTPNKDDLTDPLRSCNIIGRNLVHATGPQASAPGSVTEFHLSGIEDGAWEFDQIEPTVNHAFRFPSDVLAGLSYGAKFCDSVIGPEEKGPLDILEVGGGTGSFAKGFLEELKKRNIKVNYHILDLSPVLIEHQKRVLSAAGFQVVHFHQNATEFDLPDKVFDLIVSNEVIADFSVAEVYRSSEGWEGPGADWIEKYSLAMPDGPTGPDRFLVNAGVFQFIQRAWKHLRAGGKFVVTEYGGVDVFPVQAFQLNHEEFSIHFGHARQCAVHLGFDCELVPLKDFLSADDEVELLDGRELHLLCLAHLLKKHQAAPLSFWAWPKFEFIRQFESTLQKVNPIGMSFSSMRRGFHFTPDLELFMALVMNKPKTSAMH
ncbi:MAG TPA: class I SAM-dependent methyltransferase [Pyrinomonadaceae bacterium]